MGTEDWGGICPKCGKPMVQKWESGSHALIYEACPSCGFAVGEAPKSTDQGDVMTPLDSRDIWSIVNAQYERLGVTTCGMTDKDTRAAIAKHYEKTRPWTSHFPSIYDHMEVATSDEYREAWRDKKPFNRFRLLSTWADGEEDTAPVPELVLG